MELVEEGKKRERKKIRFATLIWDPSVRPSVGRFDFQCLVLVVAINGK
jgi:hypothetical protein